VEMNSNALTKSPECAACDLADCCPAAYPAKSNAPIITTLARIDMANVLSFKVPPIAVSLTCRYTSRFWFEH